MGRHSVVQRKRSDFEDAHLPAAGASLATTLTPSLPILASDVSAPTDTAAIPTTEPLDALPTFGHDFRSIPVFAPETGHMAVEPPSPPTPPALIQPDPLVA